MFSDNDELSAQVAVKVGASKLIVLCKFTQDRTLRFNADAVAIAFVIAAEPHIKCRIVVWLIHNIYPPFAVKQPALVF